MVGAGEFSTLRTLSLCGFDSYSKLSITELPDFTLTLPSSSLKSRVPSSLPNTLGGLWLGTQRAHPATGAHSVPGTGRRAGAQLPAVAVSGGGTTAVVSPRMSRSLKLLRH